jgi:coniferyl-aldehyde dehydrogenase
MDQPLKSPGHNALEHAFHAMFELSRTSAAWSQKPPAVT